MKLAIKYDRFINLPIEVENTITNDVRITELIVDLHDVFAVGKSYNDDNNECLLLHTKYGDEYLIPLAHKFFNELSELWMETKLPTQTLYMS